MPTLIYTIMFKLSKNLNFDKESTIGESFLERKPFDVKA